MRNNLRKRRISNAGPTSSPHFDVGRIHSRGPQAHENLAGGGIRSGQVFEFQHILGGTEAIIGYCAHDVPPLQLIFAFDHAAAVCSAAKRVLLSFRPQASRSGTAKTEDACFGLRSRSLVSFDRPGCGFAFVGVPERRACAFG